jgi:hypothetical protein
MNQQTSEIVAKFIFKVAVLSVAILTYILWPNFISIALVWVLAIPVSLLVAFIVGMLMPVSNQDESNPEDDTEEEPGHLYVMDEGNLVKHKSENIVGVFGGQAIYEWIEIENPETKEPLKLFYDGTYNADSADMFAPPEDIWWALIKPGILYIEKV